MTDFIFLLFHLPEDETHSSAFCHSVCIHVFEEDMYYLRNVNASVRCLLPYLLNIEGYL